MKECGWKHYLQYSLKTYIEGWKISPSVLSFHLLSLLLLDVVLAYVVIYINKAIVHSLTENINSTLAVGCIVGLFIIKITTSFISVLEKFINEKLAINFRLKDENRIIEKVSHIKYELLERPSYYNTYSMVNVEISSAVLKFVKDVHIVALSIVNLTISLAILIYYQAWLGVLLSLLQMLYVFLDLKYYDYQVSLTRKANQDKRKLKFLKDLIFKKENILDIKMNASGDMMLHKMNISHDALYKTYCQQNKINILLNTIENGYQNIRDYIIMLFYLLRVFSGAITITDYTLLLNVIAKATSAASTPVSYFGILMDDLRSVSDYYDFIHLTDERQGLKIPREKTEPCTIELKDFSFSYPESTTVVLKHINLAIAPGEIVAIVGENGSGKTTLVKNILGLYETYEGNIFMDDIEYNDIEPCDIYDRFSVVMQDYIKYPFTLRDNISISDRTIDMNTDDNLDQYMEIVGGTQITEQLSQGYDTFLNKEMDETGADLSEGQWQKIMLARALYRDRGVVIFDEPTASLDPIAEEIFYKNIIDKSSRKTVIIVTHRLACTAYADRIIVLKDGKIIESGKHNELISKNGVYAEMYRTQAEGYFSALTRKEDT